MLFGCHNAVYEREREREREREEKKKKKKKKKETQHMLRIGKKRKNVCRGVAMCKGEGAMTPPKF